MDKTKIHLWAMNIKWYKNFKQIYLTYASKVEKSTTNTVNNSRRQDFQQNNTTTMMCMECIRHNFDLKFKLRQQITE